MSRMHSVVIYQTFKNMPRMVTFWIEICKIMRLLKRSLITNNAINLSQIISSQNQIQNWQVTPLITILTIKLLG